MVFINKKFTVLILLINLGYSQTYMSENTKEILNANGLLMSQLKDKDVNDIIGTFSQAITNSTIDINTESAAYLKTMSGSFKALVKGNHEEGIQELLDAFNLTKSLNMDLYKNNLGFIAVQLATAYEKANQYEKAMEYAKYTMK